MYCVFLVYDYRSLIDNSTRTVSMHDSRSGPNPLPPDNMSANERLSEVGRILAVGIGRILSKQDVKAPKAADGFDILAMKNGRRRPRARSGDTR